MSYPPLVKYETVEAYRDHYESVYCSGTINTFDGIEVRFRKDRFEHCFFESTKRNQVKDQFSTLRAERIDWIKTALQDKNSELYVGWDRKRKKHDKNHRVTVVLGNYVVIIRLTGKGKTYFVTAYVADSESTIARIRKSPKWETLKG